MTLLVMPTSRPRTAIRWFLPRDAWHLRKVALEAGNFTTVAVEYAGIGRATFYRWMTRGREDQEGLYYDFYKAVCRAIAIAEVRAVTIVRRHMATSWKACMIWLERRFPQRWARRRPDVELKPRKLLAEWMGLSELEVLEFADGAS